MKNLIKLRKERGLTNEEMGKILGISKSRYNNWEIKRSEPSVLYLKKLADFFCVSIDYLVGADVRTAAPMGETLSSEDVSILNKIKELTPFQYKALMIQLDAFIESNKTVKV